MTKPSERRHNGKSLFGGVPRRTWTEDMITEISRRWKSGETNTQIAEAMGNGITRNAVMGALKRNGLLKCEEHRIVKAVRQGGVIPMGRLPRRPHRRVLPVAVSPGRPPEYGQQVERPKPSMPRVAFLERLT